MTSNEEKLQSMHLRVDNNVSDSSLGTLTEEISTCGRINLSRTGRIVMVRKNCYFNWSAISSKKNNGAVMLFLYAFVPQTNIN